jgi:hypothetical protein
MFVTESDGKSLKGRGASKEHMISSKNIIVFLKSIYEKMEKQILKIDYIQSTPNSRIKEWFRLKCSELT